MMRIAREDEHYIGRARPGVHSRVKVGFRKDGRITAIDLFIVGDNGPYDAQGDYRSAGQHDLALLPADGDAVARRHGADQYAAARRRSARRAACRATALMEPVLAKAARKLGIDQVEIHKINAPAGKAPFGPAGRPRHSRRTSPARS